MKKERQARQEKKILQLNIAKTVEEIKKFGMEKWLLKELTAAFEDARKGKINTFDEHTFEVNWLENIKRLRDAILEERYEPGASTTFVVFEPMVREIFAARFRDRIVHHFLYRLQAGWWDARFLDSSYACRVGKGTLYGAKHAQRMMRAAICDGRETACAAGARPDDPRFQPKIIKMDIKGYFMSLPRRGVYRRIKWGLDKQFGNFLDNPDGFRLYKMCVFLWKQVIFDNPVLKARRKGKLEHWDPSVLPPRKSLFCQLPGIGIVIGNLTSQLASNIYLDQLDRYVRFDLGYKWYGRYVDDFFIIVRACDYKKALNDVKKIEKFLKNELSLILHPRKRYVQDVTKGMEFIGARVYPGCVYPSDRLQNKFKWAVNAAAQGRKNPQDLVSYLGLMKNLNAGKFVKRVFVELNGVEWESPGRAREEKREKQGG